MTEAYAIANEALRARAEAAEKELAGLRPEWAKACDRIGELSDVVRAAEKERDTLRIQIQNGDYLLRPAPPTISEVMLQGALQRAETAEKERESLRAQLEAVTAERDAAIVRAKTAESVWDDLRTQADKADDTRGWRIMYDQTAAKLHTAKCRIADLEAANAAVTAENADLVQKVAHGWIEREVDARVMSDFKERTGPVAFERNQLRDELAELRPQVDDLRAKLAAAEHRAVVCEHEADEAHRAVSVLSAIICASVGAIARGVK